MEAEHFYEVSVNWLADRKGTISSPALNTSVEVATPPAISERNGRYLVARTFICGSCKQLFNDHLSFICRKFEFTI